MINVTNLGKRFGPKVLFSSVTLQLNPGERYGLVGANGSGKTTFLKILTGEEASDEGQVTFGRALRLGFLRQDQFQQDDASIVEVAMRGDPEVFEALKEVDTATSQDSPDADRIAFLTDLIARRDGYTLESRAREILVGVGIPSHVLDEPLGILSGGYKLRVLLAQVLTGRPDVLLLDEPTNHLDILSIRWLEQFLCSYEGCAVVISHDRRFLDVTSTRILDVDYDTITDYPGNYSAFLTAKAQQKLQRDAEIEKAEKLIAEKKAFVQRFRAKATKARQAQSRVKQIEKIEVKEVARSSRRAPHFRFELERPTGKDVLTVDGISKSFGEKSVLSDVGFSVRRGERIAVIGANGIGKSTLLKVLTGNLEADSGKYMWGVHANLGYFAQDHHELLTDPKLTPLDFVWSAAPHEGSSTVRGQLGRMLISGEEVDKKVTSLSGGEAARVIFARLALQKPNILLLDEPTNHLDIEAIEALAQALGEYEGTSLFVSHDRWFVSQIATRIIELTPSGLTDFAGTFDEYLEKSGEDHLDVETVTLKAQSNAKAGLSDEKLDYKERKRQANRLKSLPKKRDELVARIEKFEGRKKEIHAIYAQPDFFSSASPEKQSALAAEEKELEERIQDLLGEWETIESELEQLS